MKKIDDIFMIEDEGRLRSGYRILNTIAITAGILMVAQVIISFVASGLPGDSVKRIIISNVLIAIAGTAGIYIGRKKVDKKSFYSLGFSFDNQALKDFGFGFLVSFLMILIFFIAELVSGIITIDSVAWGQEEGLNFSVLLGLLLGLGFLASLFDEIFYRGYIYTNLVEGKGMKVAIVISCALYGLIHVLIGGTTWLSYLFITMLGSMKLLSYIRTKALWLSVGLGAGWGFFFIAFGYKMFGTPITGLISHSSLEPSWLSGGLFGPLGSILILPIFLLGTAAIVWWTDEKQEKRESDKGQSAEMDVEAAPTKEP